MGETKRKVELSSVVCFIAAAILTVVAVFFIFFGKMPEQAEEQAEPVEVYYATAQDEYVYLNMQYMTEAVAYLEAVESMQYYIVMDSEWNPSVICLYDSDMEKYQPYIDWLYTEETDNGPEEIQVVGYSVPYDTELRQFVIESYNYIFGVDFLNEENFEELFGKCYMTVGQRSDNYEHFNTGIYCLLIAVILVIIGVWCSYKGIMETAVEGQENILEVKKVHRGRGIVGALLGALLGGILWTVVGALGYISGWIGLLIFFFSFTGYKMFAREESGFGTVISFVFSFLVIFPATYFAGVWNFYQELNKNLSEYVTLGRAFEEFSDFLTRADGWEDMVKNMAMGFIFMIFAGCHSLSKMRTKKKEKKNEEEQE